MKISIAVIFAYMALQAQGKMTVTPSPMAVLCCGGKSLLGVTPKGDEGWRYFHKVRCDLHPTFWKAFHSCSI
jgi:hypothetical protein